MTTHIHNKLVRDRIPEFIQALGKSPTARAAERDEMVPFLMAKLLEEVNEYLESESAEELADIIEVIRGLAKWTDTSMDVIEKIRCTKHKERGGFEDGVFLVSVEEY